MSQHCTTVVQSEMHQRDHQQLYSGAWLLVLSDGYDVADVRGAKHRDTVCVTCARIDKSQSIYSR